MLGVVVLIVAVVALRDPKNPSAQAQGSKTAGRSTSSSGPTTPQTSSSPPTSPSTSTSTPSGLSTAQLKSQFPLVVLNNTSTTGLAAEAAHRFEDGGWTVSSTGNLVNDIISTCAYYDPAVAHAKAAARALQRQYPRIKRVEPKFDGLEDGPVVVVLTSDYSND